MKPKMLASEAASFLNISLQALHKQLKTKELKHYKAQNKTYFEHETAQSIFKLNLNPTCIVWQNLKGGVGKTNLTFSTAIRLSLYGAKVALIDLDQQGNLTQACGVDAEETPVLIDIINDQDLKIEECMVPVIGGIDILPSRIENAVLDNVIIINQLRVEKELCRRVNTLKEKYDFIFIDCPPSLGATVNAASLAADFILVPVDPEKFSLSGLNVTLKELESNLGPKFDMKFNIKILLNKFDGRTSLSHSVLRSLFDEPEYRDKLIKTFIRTSQEFPNTIAKGKTIFDFFKNSTAREDIDLLTREIIEMCSKPEKTKETKSAERDALLNA
jgi:chromosome partitioning protein